MRTALDSNVVIALWSENDSLNLEAKKALDGAARRGGLVVCAPVYLEMRAFPARTEARVEDFLRVTGIEVDWQLEELVWREAGRASHAYSVRRAAKEPVPRRVAADFIIGAHASLRKVPLLTLDRRGFRVSFPSLRFAPESS